MRSVFFFPSRRRHTRLQGDWSSDVCSSDLAHVLLVEDEPVNAAVAQGYLMALGCTSVWVKDGAEAVARNAAERFDLIFMDRSEERRVGEECRSRWSPDH